MSYFQYYNILASNVYQGLIILLRFFKKVANFVYITNIHMYERTLVLKKYAHNITNMKIKKYTILDDVFTKSHYKNKNLHGFFGPFNFF